MRNTIICTVGTSLLTNLKRLEPKNDAEKSLKRAFENSKAHDIVTALLVFQPTEQICGAEINTITALVKIRERYNLNLRNFIFVVSDTKDGMLMGQILNEYVSKAWKQLGLDQEPLCEQHTVEGLQDERPWDFKHYGLRNLIRQISAAVQAAGGLASCVIDATGGYKAQIAIAVMFGQMTGIPVFYKHERFNQIIDFPPMPVNFDFSMYEEYFDLLYRLCIGNEDFDETSLPGYFGTEKPDEMHNNANYQRFRVFLEEVEGSSGHHKQGLYSASPAAFVYFEAANQRMERLFKQHQGKLLLECSDEERRGSRFTDDHFPINFKEYVNSLFEKYKWIKSIHTIPYDKQKGIRKNGFYLATINGEKQLIGTYFDTNRFGARFRILLKDQSDTTLIAALQLLNRTTQ